MVKMKRGKVKGEMGKGERESEKRKGEALPTGAAFITTCMLERGSVARYLSQLGLDHELGVLRNWWWTVKSFSFGHFRLSMFQLLMSNSKISCRFYTQKSWKTHSQH